MGDSDSTRFSAFKYLFSLFSAICTFFRRFLLRVLAVGPIPKHIAIIMDGNRRFADRSGMERIKGHVFGYDSLIKTLENCMDLGIKYVSVYAFSIDNFGRSEDEVNSLMRLMEEKLDYLVTKDSLLKDYGVKVQVLGDLDLLPVNVRAAAERVMAATMDYGSFVLNLCVAYTSTAEIVHAIQELQNKMLMNPPGRTPCSLPSVNGQLPGYGARRRVKNGIKHEPGDFINGKHQLKNVNGHANGNHSPNLEIMGKRNADAALLPALCSSYSQGDFDMDFSGSRNGARRCDSMNGKSLEHVNGRAEAELCNGLAVQYGCEDESPSGRNRSEGGSDDLDLRKEQLAWLDSLTEEDLESHLYTAGCPAPDILIRTSGETRLSNFMLWQCCSYSRLSFIKVLWPDFGLRHIVWIILDYQRAFPALQEQRRLQEQLRHGTDLQPVSEKAKRFWG